MTKIRAKAIKLYWKIAKERCPFHTEEMVHSFLEGFIDCAEYFLLRDTGLEKEIAALKERNIKDCKSFNRAVEKIGEQLNQKQYQVTKAKEIMNIAIEGIKHWGIVGGTERPFEKQAEKLFNLFLDKAEQFLSEE